MEVWALMIVGQFPEPFLEAALRSVAWLDGYAVINTDPEGGYGQANESAVRRTVPRAKLRLERLHMGTFDFAKARNAALALVPEGAYAFILDADDVHWPRAESKISEQLNRGHDMVTAHFYHHAVYKDLLHSVPARELVFLKTSEVSFHNTQGTVHEELNHPRHDPGLADYTYNHYGYVKPARQVSRRWEFYRKLGAPVHDYDRNAPDHALDDWPRICRPYLLEHPPAVREVLDGLPSAPPTPKVDAPRDVGLVLLTWDDGENLEACLRSLENTTYPLQLCVVDNGSSDNSLVLARDFAARTGTPIHVVQDGPLPLAKALNRGFNHFLGCPGIGYIGWIHPDHVFEYPDWLENLRRDLDEHSDVAKLGCQETHDGGSGWRAGNSQCYLVRRTALEKVGGFDERFEACGGWEDWDHNRRLLAVGKVMITPSAVVAHKAMATRARHDNHAAAHNNADLYREIWGDNEPPV